MPFGTNIDFDRVNNAEEEFSLLMKQEDLY